MVLISRDRRSYPWDTDMYPGTGRMRGRGHAARLGGALQAQSTALHTEAFGLDKTQCVWGSVWSYFSAQGEEWHKLGLKRWVEARTCRGLARWHRECKLYLKCNEELDDFKPIHAFRRLLSLLFKMGQKRKQSKQWWYYNSGQLKGDGDLL